MIDAIKRLRNRDGSPTKSRVANKERAGFLLYQSLNWRVNMLCHQFSQYRPSGNSSPSCARSRLRKTVARPNNSADGNT